MFKKSVKNMNIRCKRNIRKNFINILYLNNKCGRIAKKNKMKFRDRYSFAIKWVKKYHRDFKVRLVYSGIENVPKDLSGCMFIGNHQGQDDCLVMLEALENYPTSFLIRKDRSNLFLMNNISAMLNAKRIDFNDLKSQLKMYNDMASEIENGYRYIVFPEAGYTDNKNLLQEFNTPCFVPAIKSKCPIIPFCLYDTWRVFEDPSPKPVNVQCHILKPIYYEEYCDLNKKQLAELTKQRIQEKINEIENNCGGNLV